MRNWRASWVTRTRVDQRSEEPSTPSIANDGMVFTYGAFESRIQWDLPENLAIKSLFDIKLKSEGDILSLLRSMRQNSSK